MTDRMTAVHFEDDHQSGHMMYLLCSGSLERCVWRAGLFRMSPKTSWAELSTNELSTVQELLHSDNSHTKIGRWTNLQRNLSKRSIEVDSEKSQEPRKPLVSGFDVDEPAFPSSPNYSTSFQNLEYCSMVSESQSWSSSISLPTRLIDIH
jgi:hypothetical protein